MKKSILTFCASIAGEHSSLVKPLNIIQKAPTERVVSTTANKTREVLPAQTANVSVIELEVVNLTNESRKEKGLKPLQIDQSLMNAAREKSTDMYKANYFSHVSPNLWTPFERMKALKISYPTTGENIAK